MTSFKVLVVDDEAEPRGLVQEFLESRGFRVVVAESGAGALELLRADGAEIAVVFTDLAMPGMDGLELIREARALRSDLDFIVFTGTGSVENAVEAIKAGATDFLVKPFGLHEADHRIQQLLKLRSLERRSRWLESREREVSAGSPLVAQSAAMRKLLRELGPAARSESTVLITGETGTGKEVLARALHERSPRAKGPFVAVNCSAIPEELIESELFGHERGAFTGADRLAIGIFEQAEGGTLFLDEIGEMSLRLQPKLLRALEERRIRRVGAAVDIAVDFRLVAATNRDLKAMVNAGAFREDLYFRLNVVQLALPPLRERGEDLPALARALILRHSRESGLKALEVTDSFLEALGEYPFPGNVRELSNVIERSLLSVADGRLTRECLPEEIRKGRAPGRGAERAGARGRPPAAAGGERRLGSDDGLHARLDRYERELIERALAECGGDVSRAARQLQLSRSTMYAKLEKHGMKAR